jgi:2-(1,2-epoxy-1,2-dihydrophenyl)acetyl-CoA isomerase
MSAAEPVSTAYETIAVRRDGAVVTVEMHRPDALNAITLEMGRELLAAFTDIANDASVRCAILTGAGRGFSAGADLKGVSGVPALPSGRPDLGWALREVYNPFILLLREMPQPVIAAVNGPAAGVGCSFALACDHIVAARSASFLLAFVNVALVPDGGASVLVPARAGLSRGLEMSLLGEQVPAPEAHAWNLVNELVDDAELLPRAEALAAKLAAGPPTALTAIKDLLNGVVLDTLRTQLDREAAAQTLRSDSDEVVEAITAFLQKRAPSYS